MTQIKTRYLVLKEKPHGFQKQPLIVVVGKTVSKKAVLRNKIKRRVRALLAPYLKKNKNDYYVVARRESLDATYGDLQKEVNDILII